MNIVDILGAAVCCACLFKASAEDISGCTISNMLTGPWIFISAAFAVYSGPWPAVGIKLAGIVILFMIGVTGCIGAGDIKMLMALELMYGPLFAVSVAGIASLSLIIQRYFADKDTCLYSISRILNNGTRNKLTAISTGNRYPAAVFFLFGYVISMLMRFSFHII